MARWGGERRIPETYRPASLTSQRDLCRGGRQEHTKGFPLTLACLCAPWNPGAFTHILINIHTYTNFSKTKRYSHQDYFNTHCIWNSTQSACPLHSVISTSLWFFLCKVSMVYIHCTKGPLHKAFQYSWILCVEHISLQTCLPCLVFPPPRTICPPFFPKHFYLCRFKIVIRSKRQVTCLYISNLSMGFLMIFKEHGNTRTLSLGMRRRLIPARKL